MRQRFDIKVSPNAKKVFVRKEGDLLKVYTTAKAMDGKANASVIAILAKYFKVRKREIQITRGLKSRYKSITIDNLDNVKIMGEGSPYDGSQNKE